MTRLEEAPPAAPPDATEGPSMRGRLGLLLGPALFLITIAVPPPTGVTAVAWRVAAVTILMATWWVTEAVPLAATALLPLALFPLLGVVSIDAAAEPYANPVIFLFMGGFLIAAAAEGCGLHRRMALTMVRLGGAGPAQLVGGFMAATGLISMGVSNTATVAMVLPMALSVVELVNERTDFTPDAEDRDAHNFTVALLLGVAYAASIGGLGTPIGTPPNALLVGFMAESFNRRVGFVEWMAFGVPLVVVGLPLTWLLLTRVFFPVAADRIAGGREAIAAQARALGRMSRTEWTVAVVTALAAAAWLTQPLLAEVVPGISDAGIAIIAALLLFLVPTGQRGQRALGRDAIGRVPWGVLVLFGGGLSLANGIQQTGLAVAIGKSASAIGTWPIVAVALAVTAIVVFLTELTSNTAVAAALLPVVTSLAVAIRGDPMLLAVPTVLAASCGFMMPVGTPPNAMVYGSGRIRMPEMLRAGFAINLLFIALITIATVTIVPAVLGR
jgi:solute carrier family 13 (sodium-dependent dicarboxylate transporter), member 2/3/5